MNSHLIMEQDTPQNRNDLPTMCKERECLGNINCENVTDFLPVHMHPSTNRATGFVANNAICDSAMDSMNSAISSNAVHVTAIARKVSQDPEEDVCEELVGVESTHGTTGGNTLRTSSVVTPVGDSADHNGRATPCTGTSQLPPLPGVSRAQQTRTAKRRRTHADIEAKSQYRFHRLHTSAPAESARGHSSSSNVTSCTEASSKARKGYMHRQPYLSTTLRAALIDWMVEVAEVYRLTTTTLCSAVHYVDAFLSTMRILPDVLQLVGITCMMLAAKYEEIDPPSAADFAFITASTYTVDQILKMEFAVLQSLEFDMSASTALKHTERMLDSTEAAVAVRRVARYLVLLSLFDAERHLSVPAHVLAATVIAVATEYAAAADSTCRGSVLGARGGDGAMPVQSPDGKCSLQGYHRKEVGGAATAENDHTLSPRSADSDGSCNAGTARRHLLHIVADTIHQPLALHRQHEWAHRALVLRLKQDQRPVIGAAGSKA
eukprot:m.331944 g.331944  ORF g.331944 m.331944 type:complete len:492 (-) comp20490_c0_seq1:239-1714(-)